MIKINVEQGAVPVNSVMISVPPTLRDLVSKIAEVMGTTNGGAIDVMAHDYANRLGIEDDLCVFLYCAGNLSAERLYETGNPEDRHLVAQLLKDKSAWGYVFHSLLLSEEAALQIVAALRKALDKKNEGADVSTRGGYVRFCRRGHAVAMRLYDGFCTTTVPIATRIADRLEAAAYKLAVMPESELVPVKKFEEPTPA